MATGMNIARQAPYTSIDLRKVLKSPLPPPGGMTVVHERGPTWSVRKRKPGKTTKSID